MGDSFRGNVSNENSVSIGDGSNLQSKTPTFLSRFPHLANSFPRRLSLNSSNDSKPSLKRKLEDDSTFLDDSRKKEQLESSLCVSPWEFRRLRADLMESQAQIVKLEDRIDQLHKKNKESVIFFDKEKSEMKNQLESNRNTIKDLEYRLNKIRKRETECREELNEAVRVHEFEKLQLQQKLLELENENAEIKIRLEEVESGSDDLMRDLQNEVKQLREENERHRLNIEENEDLKVSLEARLVVALQDAKDAEELKQELQLAQLKIKELESEKEEFEEAKRVTIALSDKVLRVQELEKELNSKKLEVTNLRQSIHNKVMLEEMVHDLEIKLAAAENREKEIPSLKAKISELEAELAKWVVVASDFSTNPTRDSLRDYIENLQTTELSTKLEINNLNASIQSSERALTSVKNELSSMKHANEKLESALQKLKVEVQVLRKKSILVSRERDSYRQQLDLYEKDLTMTGMTTESLNNEMCSQMKSRIKNLEDSLEEYRKHMNLLEGQLKEYQSGDPPENSELIQKLKDEIRSLEETNRTLSKIRDELENKLEMKVKRGEYLSPNTKVLHFKMNPIAEAEKKQQEELNSLKAECDRLRARVKLLESGEVLNITQKVTETVQGASSQRVQELEKELETANLKMTRLKEVFRKTSQEFRDVSYLLLGYRIDLVSNNSKIYKLYNVYSNSPRDDLMFQQTKDGTMEMLTTPFAESLSKLVDRHLHKGHSIPAFLSAVTLALHASSEQSDDDEDDEDEEEDEDEDNEDNEAEEEEEEVEDEEEDDDDDSPEEIELD